MPEAFLRGNIWYWQAYILICEALENSRYREESDIGGDSVKNVTSVFVGLLEMYIFTAILLFGMAVCIYKFDISSQLVSTGIVASYGISCFFGGFLIGKKNKKKRFIWGMLLGILYFGILILVSYGVHHSLQHSISDIIMYFVLCTLTGMVGAIIG